jgi:(4S)-4-hydroxy-5-phosphonooxypentane-2,3-dione isomerase
MPKERLGSWLIEELWRELTAPRSRLASISKGAIRRELRWGGIVRPLVVLVEMLLKPSFVMRFRDLIAANAKASVQREAGCRRFDVPCDPAEPRRFVLYDIYDDEEVFAAHVASSHHLRFAASIDIQIDQRAIRRLAFCSEMATAEGIA